MFTYSEQTKINCELCRFKNDCVYNNFDEEARKTWNSIKKSRIYSNNEQVYYENDKPKGIYLVCKGKAKVMTAGETKRQMINWIRKPGEVFGHIAYFAEKSYTSNCTSVGESVTSLIEKNDFEKFLETFPAVYKAFIFRLANEASGMQHKLKDTAYKSAKNKVAHALLSSISYNTKNSKTPECEIKRGEIAAITGLALETVVRTLQAMENAKIIKRKIKCITITDIKSLKKISEPQK